MSAVLAIAPAPAVSWLLGAARRRARAYLAAGGDPKILAAGVQALVGVMPTDAEAWLAAGVLVDVQGGQCPSGALPPPEGWRKLPPEVQAALGLPRWEREWRQRWSDGRLRKRLDGHDRESARDATIAAAQSESAGDESAREMFAEVALRRCAAALREIRSPWSPK